MWSERNSDENFPRNGFYTPPTTSKSGPSVSSKNWMSEKAPRSQCFSPSYAHDHHHHGNDLFHAFHKVPAGHSPYVTAKRVQMIEKDPGKAVSLFWNAINAGDCVDSALKDMAAVMKQLNRPDEAIEAIRSFRHLCPAESQESLENVLLELYKRSGRLEEEIEVLQLKLKRIEEASAFGRRKIRLGRSHGNRVPVSPEQEYARLLGNLAWAYLQQNDYKTAEDYYRKALSIEIDRNRQCNLAICLMCQLKISEAKLLLKAIQSSAPDRNDMDMSYSKSLERALELLAEIESQSDLSAFDDEKENRCSTNARVIPFTPYKKTCQSARINEGRVLAEQCTRKRGPCSEVSDNKQKFSWQTTYTPPIAARKIPRSPFTQPRNSGDASHSCWQTDICTPRFPKHRSPIISPFTQPRSWADMVEEEEEVDQRMKASMQQNSQCAVKSLSRKLQSISIDSSSDVLTAQSTVRRSLEFQQPEKQDNQSSRKTAINQYR